MREIKAYKTKDGRLFEDNEEAISHELEIANSVLESDLRGFSSLYCKDRDISSEWLLELLCSNVQPLSLIFNKYLESLP